MLYTILLLFAWLFDQFAIFSSTGYNLSGQVTEASLRPHDSLVALYPFFVFFLVC